ncbi:MAG: CCA tRNA nucleotidyltransferase, partial [Clostridia bacterium]|nr:CCA tRNA nucleotidyltransferase [Clostridia bacterium]
MLNNDVKFPKEALAVLKRLNENGYDAYIVGGAVRDALTGRPLQDVDIATDARTEDVRRVFSPIAKVVETGVKHGTVTVVFGGSHYEITTFRSDGSYSDARHPDSVRFIGDIAEDLKRRDFTVNAMAYSEKSGVIDFFDGKGDIQKKILRAVGDPEARLKEDSLRILRAVRFSSQLGFTVEANTLEAMKNNVRSLSGLSAERIFAELTRRLCGKYRYKALKNYAFFIFYVLPELQAEYMCDQMNLSHRFDVYDHTVYALKQCKVFTPEVSWALLLHDSGKPYTITYGTDCQRHFPDHWSVSEKIADKVLTRLKAPNELKNEVRFLCLYHDDYFRGGKPTIKRFLSKYGEKYMKDLCTVKRADWLAHSDFGVKRYEKAFNAFCGDLDEVLNSGDCYRISDLEVDGDDIVALGFSGKAIGDVLRRVLDKVIDGEL